MDAPSLSAGLADVSSATMPPTLELLSYYRRRIEDFEAERAEFLKRFKVVEVTVWRTRMRSPL